MFAALIKAIVPSEIIVAEGTGGYSTKPAWLGMEEFESLDGGDDWDSDFASDLVGCTLLVGLTYVDHEDRLLRRQQLFGTVLSVDSRAGIVIRQANNEEFVIAPALEAIEAASPGIYQLADENEAVEDPDFTAMLTIRSPLRS
ncbi:hypothetical protein [Sphingomonas faeni]|uniref:hypothetical protein n=1 Tax=Sphingomonas faeni TaxID=185950 RepID=UPI0033571461